MSGTAAAAPIESAGAFLHRIYRPFFRNAAARSAGLEAWPIYDRRLSSLMDEDTRLAGGDIPALDGNPLCDCQDWCALKHFATRLRRTAPGRWSARVAFTNCGRPDVLTYKLVSTGAGWRVADIGSVEVPSLVTYLVSANAARRKK